MKRFMLVALVALALIAPASAQAVYNTSGPTESYVKIRNETGTMVWITAYSPRVGGDKIQGAWPVQPHSYDEHGLRTLISDVRAEINAHPCAGNTRLDEQLGTTRLGKSTSGATVYELKGLVRFTGGKCTFTS